jgi:peptidoglycan/LPS O-acetylase OafA/YrhL
MLERACHNYRRIPSMLLRRLLRLLPVLVAVAAFVFIWTLVGLQNTSQPRPEKLANAFLWGGRWFNESDEFAQWLHQRGAGYTRWAKHHPQDLAVLEGVFYPPRTASPEHG